MSDSEPKLYRPNVGLAVFGEDGRVFIGQRKGVEGPFAWQMPQGGIDAGETPLQAAYRELHEEIGVAAHLVDLLEETVDWLSYDFPEEVRIQFAHRGNHFGQRQKWFAFRFKGGDSDIDLEAHEQEFTAWRWEALKNTPGLVVPFKRATYETIAQRFERYSVGALR